MVNIKTKTNKNKNKNKIEQNQKLHTDLSIFLYSLTNFGRPLFWCMSLPTPLSQKFCDKMSGHFPITWGVYWEVAFLDVLVHFSFCTHFTIIFVSSGNAIFACFDSNRCFVVFTFFFWYIGKSKFRNILTMFQIWKKKQQADKTCFRHFLRFFTNKIPLKGPLKSYPNILWQFVFYCFGFYWEILSSNGHFLWQIFCQIDRLYFLLSNCLKLALPNIQGQWFGHIAQIFTLNSFIGKFMQVSFVCVNGSWINCCQYKQIQATVHFEHVEYKECS